MEGKLMEEKNPILFVGAGPGDPELITVKGRRALRDAQVVIFAGSLVPAALLQWTGPGAETHDSASMALGQIIRVMAEAHRAGKKVVRLHTGDPSLYGAIFEQMVELDRLAIAYRVIPGVTAAFAAAAALGIEYTIPEVTQTLILTRMAGRTPVPDTERLETLARHQASMAIYLSMGLIDRVAPILSAAYGAESMCAVVYRASHPDETITTVPIGELVQAMAVERITKHALIIVGPALCARQRGGDHRSRLYDAGFSHQYRKCEERPCPDRGLGQKQL
ncbi:MAG: precorrin-4 C(11)-methyltransferase [Desulfobacteraceae bacterium]|jgi:precorrin-4/cobalt-precorrin-4 C11-methyltransferase